MNLAQQQQALLAALWQPRHADAIETIAAQVHSARASGPNHWKRGLLAYRSNAQELAQRSLAAAYPVVAQLLGPENFDALARVLWSQHPPRRGDLAQWGGDLAQLVADLPDLAAEEPYLADVARAEWALHGAATAPDTQVDLASFGLVVKSDPAHITLLVGPGAAVVASSFPVASIVLAHMQGDPSLEEAGRLLRDQVAQTALVWREGLQPRLQQAVPGEAAFLAALLERRSLLEALEGAADLDFNAWLPLAVRSGLLVGARAL